MADTKHRDACKAILRCMNVVEDERTQLEKYPDSEAWMANHSYHGTRDEFKNEHARSILTLIAAYQAIQPPTRAAIQRQLGLGTCPTHFASPSREDIQQSLRVVTQFVNIMNMLYYIQGSTILTATLLRFGLDQEAYDVLRPFGGYSMDAYPSLLSTAMAPCSSPDLQYPRILPRLSSPSTAGQHARLWHDLSLAAVLLVKFRLLVDLRAIPIFSRVLSQRLPPEICDLVKKYLPTSGIFVDDHALWHKMLYSAHEHQGLIQMLEDQLDGICRTAAAAAIEDGRDNVLRRMLITSPNLLDKIGFRSSMDRTGIELEVALQALHAAWAETPGGLNFIREKSSIGSSTVSSANPKVYGSDRTKALPNLDAVLYKQETVELY